MKKSEMMRLYFKNMSIANINGHYDRLFVAPNSMKDKILALIQGEIEKAQRGEPAEILVKINSLTDRKTIDALKDASQAGVARTGDHQRHLLPASGCGRLYGEHSDHQHRRQVPGTFQGILLWCGRRAEHVYIFSRFYDEKSQPEGRSGMPCKFSAGSKEVLEILELMLSDNVKARNLRYDGLYEKKGIGEGGERIDSQQELINRAITRAAASSQSRKTAQEMPVEDDGFFSRLKRAIFG